VLLDEYMGNDQQDLVYGLHHADRGARVRGQVLTDLVQVAVRKRIYVAVAVPCRSLSALISV
jgi:hypothetical protein